MADDAILVVSDGSDDVTTTTVSSILTTIATTLLISTSTPQALLNTTKYPPPKNWTPQNSENSTRRPHMGATVSSIVPDQVAYGVVACITVGVLIIMLYMALFGQRIRATAAKWHVVNVSVWGILHLAAYCSYATKAPWPGYITNTDITKASQQVECITRSVFPAGMIFVYLEQIILTIAPRLANSLIFNTIFFILLIPFLNLVLVFLYYAHFMDYDWWYEPADLFNLGTYVLFVTFTIIYFLFCLFGTCLCCATLTSNKPTSRTVGTFADMWLLFPYGMIPSIMYGPSFGMTSVSFAMKYLLTWVMESGLLGGGSSSSGGSAINMNLIIQVMTNAILAMPWFVLLFPLVEAVLTLVCIRMFREQFFFTMACGRVYEGQKGRVGIINKQPEEWAGPPPIYPTLKPE
ncbi:unnamed protein product [Caenorhabditis angaria]|uniref:Uncharacterized protein n=1 Tax=Caenorhabditis angaria TaxID=860376 RepID=A0A9P1IA58_9PELO|nr:unnamed protein product [Caenorhabditis angaria]